MHDEYDFDRLENIRAARDQRFRSHYASPIPEEHLSRFEGLSYFPARREWALSGAFIPGEGRIGIRSSTGGTTGYRVAGTVSLRVDGESVDLIVLYGDEGDMFAPFRDETCGIESYGGGRYVPVAIDGDSAVIDFNLAVNPWCAYDDEFSCPLPPPQNRLPMRVEAGERDYRSR